MEAAEKSLRETLTIIREQLDAERRRSTPLGPKAGRDRFSHPVSNHLLVAAIDVSSLSVDLVLSDHAPVLAGIHGPTALDSSPLVANALFNSLSNRLALHWQGGEGA